MSHQSNITSLDFFSNSGQECLADNVFTVSFLIGCFMFLCMMMIMLIRFFVDWVLLFTSTA